MVGTCKVITTDCSWYMYSDYYRLWLVQAKRLLQTVVGTCRVTTTDCGWYMQSDYYKLWLVHVE